MATNMAFHNYDTYTGDAQDANWTVDGTAPLVLGNSSGVQQSPYGNFTVDANASNTYDGHIVKGKLLRAEVISDLISKVNSNMDAKQFEERIKLELCQKIVEEMYKSGMIQFMKQEEHHGQYVNYRAYVYVTSSDDVQVIRKVLK